MKLSEEITGARILTNDKPGGPMWECEMSLQALKLKMRDESDVRFITPAHGNVRLTEMLCSEMATGKSRIDFITGDFITASIEMDSWDALTAFLGGLSKPFEGKSSLAPEKTDG